MLTPEQNDKLNRLNSALEITLTLSIFISSFLILTVEKDWWGGYLSVEKNSQVAQDFHEWLRYGKQLRRPNPSYRVENTIRFVVVGCSISFFLIMMFLDILTGIVLSLNFIYCRLRYLVAALSFRRNETQKCASNGEIQYNSQLIVSNIQMLVIFLSVACFGLVIGTLQAAFDPENALSDWKVYYLISRELLYSEVGGGIIGALCGFTIEAIRQIELKKRSPYTEQEKREQDTPHADSDNLNFDTDSECEFLHCDFHLMVNKKPGLDRDEEERVSLIDINNGEGSKYADLECTGHEIGGAAKDLSNYNNYDLAKTSLQEI